MTYRFAAFGDPRSEAAHAWFDNITHSKSYFTAYAAERGIALTSGEQRASHWIEIAMCLYDLEEASKYAVQEGGVGAWDSLTEYENRSR